MSDLCTCVDSVCFYKKYFFTFLIGNREIKILNCFFLLTNLFQNGVLDAERAKAITLIEARTKIEKAEEDKQEGALLNEMKKNRETTLIDIGTASFSQLTNALDLDKVL